MRTFMIGRFLTVAAFVVWGQGLPGSHRYAAQAEATLTTHAQSAESQPGAVSRTPDAADTDVLHYDLSLEVDPATKSLHGSSRMVIRSLTDGLRRFRFQLSDTFTITDLRVDDAPAAWTRIDPGHVDVTLPAAPDARATFALLVTYSGVAVAGPLGEGVSFTTHDDVPEVWTFSCPFYSYRWRPVKEANSDKATMRLAVTVPDTMTVASNGLLQSVDHVGADQKRFVWQTDYPIAPYLVCFAATNFVCYETAWRYEDKTMPLSFYIYPESDSPAVREELDKVRNMLTVFSRLFGPFPFINEKYGIYQWQLGGGMENQTMTAQYSLTTEWMTAHELAHEWWGDAVTAATWHDVWLSEGFATYAEALWMEHRPDGGGAEALHATMAKRRPGDIVGSVYAYDISSFDTIFNVRTVYRKAAWVLHALRHVVGDDAFWAILRTWRAAYEGSAATTDDFVRVCSNVTGRDLGWFFDEWIYHDTLPTYEYAWQDHAIGGRHYVEVLVRQAPQSVYAMPIDLAVTSAAGPATFVIWSDAEIEHHLVPIGADAATAVAFDPLSWFLHRDVTTTAFVAGPPKIVTLEPAPGSEVAGHVAALEVGFHQDVALTADSFALVGRQSGPVPLDVTYDSSRYVATLTPATPLAPDAYTLTVRDSITSTAGGLLLDGELTKPWLPEPLPSGDGKTGGDAVSRFVVVARPSSSH